MSRRRPFSPYAPDRIFVIEVIDVDHGVWTAAATEREGILRELKNAPPAAAITIFEWWLAEPVNPQQGVFSRAPSWKLMERYPWTLERSND